jgi:galactokinase
MTKYAVECKYRKHDTPEVIAIFDRKIDADRYASRHDGAGRCMLSVIESDHIEHFGHTVEHMYDKSKPRASFRYKCEALLYVGHRAHWNEGYYVAVEQALSESVK